MLRSILPWIAAALMVLLWFSSKKPWSERQDITSQRNWSGTREFSEAKSPDAIGAVFYFGGTSALLLTAIGVVGTTRAGNAADRLPAVIAIGAAILGGIALVRFKFYFDGFGEPTLLRFGGSGHYPTMDLQLSFLATIALAAIGLLLLFLGSAPKKPRATGAAQVPESGEG